MILALLACTTVTGPPEEEKLATVSHQVTFESVTRLGPHRLDLTARHELQSGDRTEGFVIAWGGWDDFQVVRSRKGRVTQDTRVLSGKAYTSTDGEIFHPQDDAELYRTDLATTWDEWDRQLEPVLAAMVLTADRETVVEGRPAQRYLVSMDPDFVATGRNADVPTSLSGHLTVDSGSGVRLVGEVHGEYLENGDPDKPSTVTLNLLRSGLGEDVTIDPPTAFPTKKGKRRKKAKKPD